MKTALVTGAGGFIGHHLVKFLKLKGYLVRGVDRRLPEFETSPADEFLIRDLRYRENALWALQGNHFNEVYHLAATMGGIGFIESHKAEIVRDNTLINVQMIEAAKMRSVDRFLFSSSACVYPSFKQNTTDILPLREEDAYPADPEDGYGWEKLMMERMCRHYSEDYGLATRVVRFHNIFGPLGTFEGGREKSPAAICRKVARAYDGNSIEIWGDGLQTRSYCYVSDCVEGIYRLMQSDHAEPLNLGQDRMISINQLVDMVCAIAGKQLTKRYDLDAPKGVRGRNSDNSKLREVLQWEPTVSLEDGLKATYEWIVSRVHTKRAMHG